MNFTPKRVSEDEAYAVDFSAVYPDLAPGVTILSATWSNSVVKGVDPNAAAMVAGDYTIDGLRVTIMIKGGVPGVQYAPRCQVVLSDTQKPILPDIGEGYLQVFDDKA